MKKHASNLALTALAVSTALAAPVSYSISTPDLRLPQDIAADGHGAVRLRLVYAPATADVSAQQWHSSDPSVATVAADGTLELLKAGQTDIIVSFGGAKSEPCKLTVLPPENRTAANRNLRSVPPVERGTNRINKHDFLRWPEQYGDTVIALWHDDKTGAYSMTADDGHFADIWRWNEIVGRWGGAITLGPSPGLRDFTHVKDKHGNGWAEFIKAGNEVQSHSLVHATGATRSTWTSADFLYDLYKSRDLIQQSLADLGLDTLTRSQIFMAADGGWPAEYVARFYTAGRNGGSIYPGKANMTDKASPDDYMQVWLTSAAGPKEADGFIRPLIDYSIEDGTATDAKKYHKNLGGLKNVLVHQIHDRPGANGLYFSDHIEWIYENYLHPNRDRLWYDNFTNMTTYAQQRDTTEILNKTVKPDTISFDITNVLDSELFDYPLTIKVKLDNSWNKLTVTQDGKPVQHKGGKPAASRLVRRDGQTYALVKAIPDRGTVVLTKQGTEKKYSADSRLAKLEYRPDVWKIHDNPRLEVPAFDPAKTDYTVTLPPGTPTVAIYGTPACEAATSKRDPLMGIVALTTAPDGASESRDSTLINSNLSNPSNSSPTPAPSGATITVTAENGTTTTYRITFTIEPFEPIQSLALTATDWRGETPNLAQVTTSEPLYFTVKAEKETLDSEGNLLTRRYDPDTIQWLVNGTVQDDAKGLTFHYTPATYGTYQIHARAGKIESNKIAATFTKGPPVATRTLWQDDFTKYKTGDPIPLTTDPDPSVQSWTDRAATPLLGIPKDDKWHNLAAAEIDGKKAARWTTEDLKTTGALAKLILIEKAPLVIAAKVRIDRPEGDKRPLPSYGTAMASQFGGRMAGLFNLADNGQWTGPAGFGPGWAPGKWTSYAAVIDPCRLGEGVARTYVASEHDPEFRVATGRNGFLADWSVPGTPPMRGILFTFHGGPNTPADLGKYSSYLADVRIYHPSSLVMTPAKPAFGTTEPVRMNFTHHVNIATLKPETVKVTDSRGATVPVETIKTDPLDFDHFVMTFASGALKRGETYTVALDQTVRDIMDKTAYDVATFKVN